jgi:hypothetical protein
VDEPQDLRELRDRDAGTRAKLGGERAAYYQDLAAEFSRIRKEAVGELAADGMTQQEIATFLGMTRARVGQLLSTGPRVECPERALLGTGAITIAIGGKPEGPRTNGSTMISVESSRAADLVADAAESYGLKAVRETVPPPGMVQLNRPNLVVIGSPRLLPLVGQVLGSDSNLGFGQGAQGWYLTEHAKGKTHRSPSDQGEPTDYGYIGRLPRPDGKGTFLYLAGIHAMGTLGAATYLTENIVELYSTVRNRRWSALIECRYNPDTRAIGATDRITEIYC